MEIKFKHDASQHAIESVTIYRDGGAKVYRKFELSHKGGRYEVQIINLPSCIQEVSARVRFDNSQVAAVRVIRHEKQANALEGLNKKKKQIQEKNEIILQKRKTLWALLTESGSGSPQKSLPELQLVMQLLNGLQKEILNVDDEISKVEEEEE